MTVDPTLEYESALWARGAELVAGVDEAGRGAWAGPVVAAAVVLRPPRGLPAGPDGTVASMPLTVAAYPRADLLLPGVRDSKLLSPSQRTALVEGIVARGLAVGIGIIAPGIIDHLGLAAAGLLALELAVRDLRLSPDHLLIDAFRLPALPVPQTSLVRGDQRCLSIAAASIIAKVARDRLMVHWDRAYPGYGFAQHKGYGTVRHREALGELGICPLHRRSFAPIAEIDTASPLIG